jgi:hypothetical protein
VPGTDLNNGDMRGSKIMVPVFLEPLVGKRKFTAHKYINRSIDK